MTMTTKRKRIIWISSILVLLLIALAVGKSRTSKNIKVTTSKVEVRTIVETVIANGKIQPETEVIISSEVSGKILELPVKEGAFVEKGDLLVKINPDLAQASLDRAVASYNNSLAAKATSEARLIQAKAQFRNNKVIYDRSKNLYESGAISQAEYDNALAAFESSDAEVQAAVQNVNAAGYSVQSAQATVEEARDSYSRTTIYAPMSGTISKLTAEVGEQVVGAMQMTGTEIMRVANLDVMEVLVEVNESDIVRVGFGDTALIEVDAYVNRKFKGVITEIANSATSSGLAANQVTNFEVKVRVLEDSYKDLLESSRSGLFPFRPGMNATVDINTETKRNVLTVPIESVTSRSDTAQAGGKSAEQPQPMNDASDTEKQRIILVFVEAGGKAAVRAVKTGIQDDRYIEILEGLKEGDTVISGPYDAVSQMLNPGDQVEIVTKSELYEKK